MRPLRGGKRAPITLALAPVIVVPNSNVRLAPRSTDPEGPPSGDLVPPPRTEEPLSAPNAAATPGIAPDGWSVRDNRGDILVTGLPTRAHALREIGGLAVRGADLPLTVIGPDGKPTGDHLA